MCYALAFRAVVSLSQEDVDWFGFCPPQTMDHASG